MLVDTPLQPPQTGSPNFQSFEDLFNMDMISSSNSSGSSTSSPNSPPVPSFPLTPPQQPTMQSFNSYDFGTLGGEEFIGATSYLEDDYSKASTSIGYDFLSAFNALSSSSFSDSSSPHSLSDPSASPQEFFAIDPALVGTPSTGQAPSEFEHQNQHEEQHEDDDEDEGDDDDGDDNDKEHASPTVTFKAAATSTAVKVGGKGKNRKGTVVSGGVKKNKENAPAPSPAASEFGFGKDEDKDIEDWRPEEYKKMSSKEKRQLRNKISARNFRVRRKEYISTLEADIASRDSLISAIRSELGSSKSENVALRQEIAALKKTLLNGRGSIETPVLPPPGPLSPPSEQRKEKLAVANTQKDLPTSPRIGARGFWGGANLGMGSGITPVHTTFVPPMVSAAVLSRKSENINPALNMPTPPSPPPILSPSPFTSSPLPGAGSGFDAYADMNPFTLKTLDAYRMQLWGKMAAQNHQWQHHQQQQQQAQPSVTGLAGSLRPSFFRESGQQSLSGLLSGKASSSSSAVSSYSTLPSTSPTKFTAYSKTQEHEREQREHAMYAALASQTLLGKLGSAFWDAFSGGSGPSSSKQREWDADKVRKVLEGKAIVKIVDVDSPTLSPKLPAIVPVAPASKTAPVPAVKKEREHPGCAIVMADILAESMSTLTLGKK